MSPSFEPAPHVFMFDFEAPSATGFPINRSKRTVTDPLFVPAEASTLTGGAAFDSTSPLIHGSQYLRVPGGTARCDTNHAFALNVRPGAVTHHFDNDQRCVELSFTSSGAPLLPGPIDLNVEAPSEALAPPGYYMLFVVAMNNQGQRIPSEAVWIQFN